MIRIPLLMPGAEPLFPPVDQALDEPNGLLAAGGDLSPQRLLLAYRSGIFPWFGEGDPILWWSPDPRCVLWPEAFHASRSLRRSIRRRQYRFSLDQAFEAVIDACAAPRGGAEAGTWITADMRRAYVKLHRMGHAHSVETWSGEELVGGLYGVRLGPVFFGESMFSRRTDASKAALMHLAADPDLALIDCQLPTAHLLGLGACEMPRSTFIDYLERLLLADRKS